MNRSLNIDLKKRAGLGKLKVISDKSAKVLVDDILIGVTGQVLNRIRSGNRHILIQPSFKMFDPVDTTIYIQENKINELIVCIGSPNESSSNSEKRIDWRISSEPSGATVRINGEVVGTTQLTFKHQPGEVNLELSLDGYQVYKEIVKVSRITHRQLVARKAKLILSCSPGSGTIYVDDEFLGIITALQKSFEMDAGLHKIRIVPSIPVFKENTFSINLPPGGEKTKEVKFLTK